MKQKDINTALLAMIIFAIGLTIGTGLLDAYFRVKLQERIQKLEQRDSIKINH